VAPINYYAFSKYAGELAASAVGSTILRTNMFGPSRCEGRHSLSDWLVGAMRRGDQVTVFQDVFFSPLSLETLSEQMAIVVERRVPGTFNLGSRDGMSKADFAFELAEQVGLRTDLLKRGSLKDVPLNARRPEDMRMQVAKFESAFGVTLPSLKSEIALTKDMYA
jgi:dTDP-4-dehydrorhamnose reductase